MTAPRSKRLLKLLLLLVVLATLALGALWYLGYLGDEPVAPVTPQPVVTNSAPEVTASVADNAAAPATVSDAPLNANYALTHTLESDGWVKVDEAPAGLLAPLYDAQTHYYAEEIKASVWQTVVDKDPSLSAEQYVGEFALDILLTDYPELYSVGPVNVDIPGYSSTKPAETYAFYNGKDIDNSEIIALLDKGNKIAVIGLHANSLEELQAAWAPFITTLKNMTFAPVVESEAAAAAQ